MTPTTQPARPPIPPIAGMAISLFAVATAAIFIRYAQADGAPSLAIAAYRLTLSALILTPPALLRHRTELRALTPRTLALTTTAGLFLGLHFASWITSLEFTSVASSAVFVTTTPLIVGIASPLFGERLTRAMLTGILIATIGAIVIGIADSCQTTSTGWQCLPLTQMIQGRAFLGNLLAFIGAIGAAAYLLIGRRLRVTISLTLYVWLVYGTAAIVLLLAALAFHVPLLGYPPSTLRWLVLLALVPQLIGHSLWNWALHYLPAAIVSVMTLGEPIVSTILAYALLQERPHPLVLLGGGLILAGILLATFPAGRATGQNPSGQNGPD